MLKQLVIPFFVLSLAAIGCGSSSSGGTAGTNGGAGHGTAGTSGGAGTAAGGTSGGAGTAAGGTSGGAGTAAAGTSGGAGTAAAGTSGGAGTAAAGTTGADASTDAADATAPIDSSPDTVALAECTSSTATSAPMSAADFCANLEASCDGKTSGGGTLPATYSAANCVATYGTRTTAQKTCQSYHLCWGVEGKGAGPKAVDPHCSHAWGLAPCN